MSSYQAIAGVTQALVGLFTRELQAVSALTPDKAEKQVPGDGEGARLNVFLYNVTPNAAWRNLNDVPGRERAGEASQPRLALTLHYMLTAYAAKEEDAHQALGRAMSVLHDLRYLDYKNDTATGPWYDSRIGRQPERVRLTLQPLSVEDLSKLWSGFQTMYRLSVAYEASVVLIDSGIPPRPAPPVLRRGQADTGVFTRTDADPVLEAALPANGTQAVRLGEPIAFRVRDVPTPFEFLLARTGGGGGPIRAPGRIDPATGHATFTPLGNVWRPGIYTATIKAPPGNTTDAPALRLSNALPFAFAPTLRQLRVAGAPRSVVVRFEPPVDPRQQQVALLMTRKAPADEIATPEAERLRYLTLPFHPANPDAGDTVDQLTFELPANALAGDYVVRLRVDGVDSIPLTREANNRPGFLREFDPAQTVAVPQ